MNNKSFSNVVDRIIIQESSFAAEKRLGCCLDAIGVRTLADHGKFADRNPWKNQVVNGLFSIWKTT